MLRTGCSTAEKSRVLVQRLEMAAEAVICVCLACVLGSGWRDTAPGIQRDAASDYRAEMDLCALNS